MAWSTREIAELAGTTVRAVRHYHEVGLLDEPKRRANGYKQYGVAHLIRLLRIKRCPGDSGGPALNSRGNIVGIASSANSAGNSNYDPTYVAYSWIFDTEVVRRAIGKVTFLRLHDVNTGFGPPADPTPGELVVSLDSEPNVWFGLPLRVGTSEAMAKGSLDLVRDSFVNDSVIVIEHQAVGAYWTQSNSSYQELGLGDDRVASKLIASIGKVTELRVIEVGSKHGPPQDQIDVEAVAKLDTEPSRRMGFQLRNDNNRPVRQGMLDLLRDAFEIGCQTRLEYSIDLDAGKKNGVVLRVVLLK